MTKLHAMIFLISNFDIIRHDVHVRLLHLYELH
jgi:hypothetical protein